MGQKDPLQVNDIGMFQFTKKLKDKKLIKIQKIVNTCQTLTAISRHADIDRPVPSICFNAYSLESVLKGHRNVLIRTAIRKLH